MRYLLIILSFINLTICQFLPSDSELKNMTFSEKTLLYKTEKKSPVGTLLREYFIPTLGHAYVNDWKKGLYFKLAQTISLAITVDSYSKSILTQNEYIRMEGSYKTLEETENFKKKKENTAIAFGLIMLATDIYEKIYLFKKTEDYNKQLHNKIFQKDNNLSFLILPTSTGAYLNLCYKF